MITIIIIIKKTLSRSGKFQKRRKVWNNGTHFLKRTRTNWVAHWGKLLSAGGGLLKIDCGNFACRELEVWWRWTRARTRPRLRGWLQEYSLSFREKEKQRANLCLHTHFHTEETPPTRKDIRSEWARGAYFSELANMKQSSRAGSCACLTEYSPMRFTVAFSVPPRRQMNGLLVVSSRQCLRRTCPWLVPEDGWSVSLNGPTQTRLSHKIWRREKFRNRSQSAARNALRPEAPPPERQDRLQESDAEETKIT